MLRRILTISALAAGAALAQDAALQQRVAEVKQSIAENQARLRQYTWTETTEVSLKGEEKKRTQATCIYGPDGKVQKTAIGTPSQPPKKGGIRGKIIAKKVDEMTDYMDRVGSLMRRYIPPNPPDIQAAFQAGKVTLNPGTGEMVINDYAKPGDRITVRFDGGGNLNSLSIATYLDATPDAVMMDARFTTLPDGTRYVTQSILDASAKQIQVTTTNFGYRKLGS